MAPARHEKPECDQPAKRPHRILEKDPHGLVIYVHFHSLRRRLLDDDNLSYSLKFLRDFVAESLGIDDGDKRIRWEYSQAESKGEQGVIVKIERSGE